MAADIPLRLAIWSGPRNVSTALMRAFAQRDDTAVTDEPLYGAYLAETGLEHPGRDRVLASMETDWRQVTEALTGPVPGDRPIWYQKHMAHHLLDGMWGPWLDALTHVILIREPRAVVASYVRSRAEVTPEDLGIEQAAALFDRVSRRTGRPPPVLDGDMVRARPAAMLQALCDAVDIPFDPAMLSWPPGPRPEDGAWAPWWYAAVHASTGFEPPSPPPAFLPPALEAVAEACRPAYQMLEACALEPAETSSRRRVS